MKRFETFAIQRAWYQPFAQAGDQARNVPLNLRILSGDVGMLATYCAESVRFNRLLLLNGNVSAYRTLLAVLRHMISRISSNGLPRQSTTHGTPITQKTRQDQLAWRAAMMSSLMPEHPTVKL